jgi:hypothetical protein
VTHPPGTPPQVGSFQGNFLGPFPTGGIGSIDLFLPKG